MAAGTLKFSTSQFFPIGPVQKEAWAIACSSAPCRILISEEFHQNLRQLAQVFIRYRILPNLAPVRENPSHLELHKREEICSFINISKEHSNLLGTENDEYCISWSMVEDGTIYTKSMIENLNENLFLHY